MKASKTKWMRNGKEIDAYVHVAGVVITKGRLPSGRGSGGSSQATPPDYGSMVDYYISEDEDGKVVISRGQVIQVFDMDGMKSVKEFTKDALKNIPHLKDIK